LREFIALNPYFRSSPFDPRPTGEKTQKPTKMNNKSLRLRAASRGFTLIELMVVVAVIVILATIALPAYKTYALKAKFTEVVVASAPTKTAIATCAGSGECVVGGAINLTAPGAAGGSGGSGSGSGGSGGSTPLPTFPQMVTTTTTVGGVTSTTTTPLQSTPAEVWALITGAYAMDGPSNIPFGEWMASQDATGWADTPDWYLAPDANNPGSICEVSVYSYGACLSYSVPISVMQQFYNPTINPLWSSRDDAMQVPTQFALPCVAGPNCTPSTKYVASVSYTVTGTVIATATSGGGLNGETFILTPTYSNGTVDWTASGSCKTRAGGAIC